MQPKIVIFVPIYKKEISALEKKSLKQLFLILSKYHIFFTHPTGLDLSFYKNELKNHSLINYQFCEFPAHFFANISGYNQLLTSLILYKKLKKYDFFLIYQLDAFVFKDELEYWCNKGYDYIGAPWFEGFVKVTRDSKIIGVGNGGLSLRCTKKISKILKKKMILKKIYNVFSILIFYKILRTDQLYRLLKFLFFIPQGEKTDFVFEKISINEDMFWCEQVPKIFDFNIAPISEAIKFSFEVNSAVLYEMNNHELPFGCHAWQKYEPNFWKQFIDF